MRYSRRASGLYAAEAELPRGSRGFLPAFGAPFAAPIATPGGAPAGPVTLILDQFTDTNGTALTSHTIAPTNTPSTHWSNSAGGVPTIQGNRATVAAEGGINNGLTVDAGVADCTVSCIVRVTGGTAANTSALILLRGTANNNSWYLQITLGAGGVFRLVEDDAVVRASTPFVLTSGQDYTFKAILSGTSIKGYVDDANEISYTSSLHQTNTTFGIRPVSLAGGGTVEFDDFTITVP